MNEIMPYAATWMDLEMTILRQTEKENIIWYHLYLNSKRDTNELIYINILTDIENKIMVTKGKRVGDKLAVRN